MYSVWSENPTRWVSTGPWLQAELSTGFFVSYVMRSLTKAHTQQTSMNVNCTFDRFHQENRSHTIGSVKMPLYHPLLYYRSLHVTTVIPSFPKRNSWPTLDLGFLYVEIGVILLLLVPFISSKYLFFLLILFTWKLIFRMWNKVFRSNLIRGLESQLIYYFYVLVAILILFFLDSIREMQKYSSEEQLTRECCNNFLSISLKNSFNPRAPH